MWPSSRWLLIPVLAVGARTAELPLFNVTFGRPLPPLVTCVEPATNADGMLHSATVPGWRRSGLRVGPLPLPQGKLSLTYEFRPLALGPQSQELTSEVPSTHWYMLFADAGGRYHLHTRVGNEWAQRQAATQPIEVGTWYRAEVTLTATSIAGRISEHDGGKVIFEFAATPVDDLGAETTFYLTDEGPEAGTGRTEWSSLTIGTDDPGLKAQIDAKVAQVRREQREREAMVAASRRLRELGVALLPWPREVQVGAGAYRITPQTRIAAPSTLRQSAAEVRAVLQERCRRDVPLGDRGINLATTRQSEAPPAIGWPSRRHPSP
ncbi:MAG: hypothetical protein HYU66_20915 [Armatimonadetes bacterium]|nr:hypothetical protein [Armatimonadota bacterium]